MQLPIAKSNSFFSNSVFIFITRFFPSLANLLVVIWYSRQLEPAAYGNYQHFWIQLFVIYPFICFGIHVLAVTYPRGVIAKILAAIPRKYYWLYALWVAVLSAVFAILQANTLQINFLVSFLFIAAYALSLLLEAYLIVCRSFKGLVATNILYSLAYCAVHWVVVQQVFSLQTVFSYLLVVTLCRLAVYILMAGGNNAEPEGDVSTAQVKTLWLHMGVYDVSQVLFSWIDKYIISLVLAAGISAVYINGSMNIPILPLLIGAAGSAVLIQLAAGHKDNEREHTIQLMNQTGRLLSCIVFPVFIYLLTNSYDLVVKLFTIKYEASAPIFMVSILVLPLRAYSFSTVLQRLHKGNLINAGAIGDLVIACGLMYPLYRWLGLPGVALSFVISTYMQATFYLYHTAKLLHTSMLELIPYVNWLVKLIVYYCLFITIHYVGSRYFTTGISLILGGVVMAIVVAISLMAEYKKQNKYGGG
jgi:hypothetical protein